MERAQGLATQQVDPVRAGAVQMRVLPARGERVGAVRVALLEGEQVEPQEEREPEEQAEAGPAAAALPVVNSPELSRFN